MMPTLTAARGPRIGLRVMRPSRRAAAMASDRATKAPVMAAVRVPPSAQMTSQSQVMAMPGILLRSTAARRERPMRRWISVARLLGPRRWRSGVEPGIMLYSAVTHPRGGSASRSQRGGSSLMEAVQRMRVLPTTIMTLPGAAEGNRRWILTGRSWLRFRAMVAPDGCAGFWAHGSAAEAGWQRRGV